MEAKILKEFINALPDDASIYLCFHNNEIVEEQMSEAKREGKLEDVTAKLVKIEILDFDKADINVWFNIGVDY